MAPSFNTQMAAVGASTVIRLYNVITIDGALLGWGRNRLFCAPRFMFMFVLQAQQLLFLACMTIDNHYMQTSVWLLVRTGLLSRHTTAKPWPSSTKGLTRNRTQTQVAVLALGFCKNPCRGSSSLHLLPASASIGLFVVACETTAVAAATFLPNATAVMFLCNVAAGGTAMLFDYYTKTVRLCSQATKVKALVAKASTPGLR